ncbi:TPA: sugar-phosphate nucleotidyltransferase, partial [Listeria monocytogenes]
MTMYELRKTDKDHVETPRYVVEDIYSLIDIESFKSLWFPFNHYDSLFKLRADELNLKYKATHIFDNVG